MGNYFEERSDNEGYRVDLGTEFHAESAEDADSNEDNEDNDSDDLDCPSCNGTGYDPQDGGQCEDCHGTGDASEAD